MAYGSTNFSFNPQKGFTFNPSDPNSVGGSDQSAVGVNENLYVPRCDEFSPAVENQHNNIMDYARNYGMTISYQPVIYNTNTHNFLYGEDPTSGYRYARKMKAIINFESYSTFFTRFGGAMSESTMTIYIPIREFERVWGPSKGQTYPLAGDLFYVVDSACDRPLGQSQMVWEVTDKNDSVNPVDFMGRHYVWKLNAQRFQYSYEPNAPEEKFLDDTLSDTGQFGRLEGGANPPDMSTPKDNVNVFAKEEFENKESSTYGNYY